MAKKQLNILEEAMFSLENTLTHLNVQYKNKPSNPISSMIINLELVKYEIKKEIENEK
jgi:hypothetical protein